MQGKNNVINSKKNIDDRPDEYDVEKVWRCHSCIVPNGCKKESEGGQDERQPMLHDF